MRLKQLFLDSSNGIALGLRYLFIMFMIAYGSLYGILLNKFHANNPFTESTIIKLEMGFVTFILFAFLFKNYFPQYKASTQFVNPFYPVSRSKKAIMHLVNDLTSSIFVAAFVFGLMLYSISEFLEPKYLPSMVLILMSGILIERNIRQIWDFNHKFNGIHLVLILITAGALLSGIAWHLNGQGLHEMWIMGAYALVLILSFLHTIFLESTFIAEKEKKREDLAITESKSLYPTLLQLSLRANKPRMGIIISFAVKIFLGIIAVLIGMKSSQSKINIIDIYQFIIFSPTFIVIQVFGNFFGYYRKFWLASSVYNKDKISIPTLMFQIMGTLILFDVVFSSVLMLSIYELSIHMWAYYIASIPVVVYLSIYSTYRFPSYVESVINTSGNNNVSPFIGFIMIIIIAALGALTAFKLIIWITPLVYLLVYLLYRSWPKKQHKLEPHIYDRLFKS